MLCLLTLALATIALEAPPAPTGDGPPDPTLQRVLVEPMVQTVASGDTATVTVLYESADSTVTGFSVRLHYDSSKITVEDAEVLFKRNLVGAQDRDDSSSMSDNDPATDRRYIAAWGLGSGFPGSEVAMPVKLLRLRFRTHGVFPSTRITVTGDRCANCTLEVQPVDILIAGAEPTATATPTPSP